MGGERWRCGVVVWRLLDHRISAILAMVGEVSCRLLVVGVLGM